MSAVLFTCLFILLVYITYSDLSTNGWTILSYFSIYFAIFYALAPAIFYFNIRDRSFIGEINYSKSEVLSMDSIIFPLIIICSFYIVFRISYKFTYRGFKNTELEPVCRTTLGIPTYLYVSVFLSVFSAFALIMYVRGFGSFADAFANANLVRSGYYKDIETGDTSHTIFKRFIPLALIPFIVYLSFVYNSTLKRNPALVIFLLLIPAASIGVFYFLLSRGRQSILDLLLIFVIGNLLRKNQIYSFKFIIIAICALPLLVVLDYLFTFNDINDLTNIFNSSHVGIETSESNYALSFVREFIFPYFSLIYSMTKGHNFFYFSDLYYGIFGTLLPSNPNYFGKETVILNTFYAINEMDATVPPGIIAWGYYNLSIIGALITAVFYGVFFGFLDSTFKRIKDIRFYYLYAYLIVVSLIAIRTGLPRQYLYHCVILSTFIFLVLSFKVIRKKTD